VESIGPTEAEPSPETEETAAQEPPKPAAEAPQVDIVTVVDDLLDGPTEAP
jgi:hypothetical protein